MRDDTFGNVCSGRQSALILTQGSQILARGLHCTNKMTTKTEVEVTKNAIVANNVNLSHFQRPPILNRKRVMDIFTTRIMRSVSISDPKISLPARTICV